MPRDFFIIAESRHEIQNPTSEEKLLLLGERLELDSGSRVLDLASGRGGPALILARTFGCAVHGIEIRPEFHAVAVERAANAGLIDRVTFELADAAKATIGMATYDVAMCLGASFVYGGLAGTLDALEPAVRPGGRVVVGEPFWKKWPLPEDYEDRDSPFTSLEGTVTVMESGDLRVVTVIVSADDDWDRYETLHWQSVEQWLAANTDDPDAPEIRRIHEHGKWNYLRHQRDYLGWAIFVGWKHP